MGLLGSIVTDTGAQELVSGKDGEKDEEDEWVRGRGEGSQKPAFGVVVYGQST